MTEIGAEKIIEKFHKSIKDLRPNSIVQSDHDLPFTSAWIKYAHLVYGEWLINQNKLTRETAEMLIESYGIIDVFFVDDPESINIKYREFMLGLKNGIITDFRMPNPFGDMSRDVEYYNFLGEGLSIFGQNSILKNEKGEHPLLPTFVYDLEFNELVKNSNLKDMIKLVNTSLTRAVSYPGKKSNQESNFI